MRTVFLIGVCLISAKLFASVIDATEIANETRIGALECVETAWQLGKQSAHANCPTGFQVFSGGCANRADSPHSGNEDLLASYIDSTHNRWSCLSSLGYRWLKAKAFCCR